MKQLKIKSIIIIIMDSDINEIFKKLGGGYEVRVNFDFKITRDLFEKIVQRFIYSEENGGMGCKYNMKSSLDVIFPESDYFIYIDGKDEVKKFWQFSELPVNCYHYDKVVQEISLDKYGVDIKVIDLMEKAEDAELLKKLEADSTREYKFHNYYEVEDTKYRFKTNLIEEKRVSSTKKFRESGCIAENPNFYLNIVFSEELDEGFQEYFGIYLRWILEELQQSNFITTIDEKVSLLGSYKKLTKQTELKSNNFILVEPIDILRRNFHKNDQVPYVKEGYSMTYQLSGEIRFMYISENFSKNVDGKIFMITRNFEIINTGRMIQGFENTLLEGYYDGVNNLFYLTDILYYKGKDIRQNHFYVPGGKAKEKYRYDYLSEFYKEAIMKAEYIDEELKDECTRIIYAKYLFGDGPRFEENINELFDRVRQQDFPVSGIMFRPNAEPYPEKAGYWFSLLKWDYPQYKTADFLVEYEMEGKNPKISPFQLPSKGKDLFGKIIYYKTLNLFVGGFRDVPDSSGNERKEYQPVPFSPQGVDQFMRINIANIPVDDAGNVVAKDIYGRTEKIESGSIVEFSYQKTYGEFTNIFKWFPVRVNHYKTRQYRDGESVYGMSESYANILWNSLSNFITETHLREGTVPEEEITTYYANNSMRLKKFPFQIFHNRVVKDHLITSVCPAVIAGSKTMMGSLLDLACGSGGDFMKWKIGLLKTVVGLDIVKDNIETATELYRKAKRPKPEVTYIWGDCSKLIFPEYEAAMDYTSRELMKKNIMSKYQYDVVSIQFAIHYMCKSEVSLRCLLQNVTDNLKVGGYFVGTSLDGERVSKLLKDKKSEVGMVGDEILWTIGKHYSMRSWDQKKPNLGEEIDVFVSTIGISHREFLVNYDYLKELAKEYGLEVVSIRGFEDIYEEAIRDKTDWIGDLKNMSAGEKMFSFLHNEFTFIKKKNAGDITYTKLLKLINKENKREERMANFSNKRISFRVKKGGLPARRRNSNNQDGNSSDEGYMSGGSSQQQPPQQPQPQPPQQQPLQQPPQPQQPQQQQTLHNVVVKTASIMKPVVSEQMGAGLMSLPLVVNNKAMGSSDESSDSSIKSIFIPE